MKSIAAAHGRSMEEAAGQVLRAALAPASMPKAVGFGDLMRALFEPLNLPEPEREPLRNPPDFSGPVWDPKPSM